MAVPPQLRLDVSMWLRSTGEQPLSWSILPDKNPNKAGETVFAGKPSSHSKLFADHPMDDWDVDMAVFSGSNQLITIGSRHLTGIGAIGTVIQNGHTFTPKFLNAHIDYDTNTIQLFLIATFK